MTTKEKFESVTGWTTQFVIDGVKYGGDTAILANDPRLHWHIQVVGGLDGKTVLELGPLEGAHTKTMIEAGAVRVLSVDGNKDCYDRCLIVQDVFGLDKAMFVHADFCGYCVRFAELGGRVDIVSAAGVLYHQLDPAKLIHDLARITDTVLVWSQVASPDHPNGNDDSVSGYGGRWQYYNDARDSHSYCGGPNDRSFWMFPDEMLRCFKDAGFVVIVQGVSQPNVNGDSLLFVASKNILPSL